MDSSRFWPKVLVNCILRDNELNLLAGVSLATAQEPPQSISYRLLGHGIIIIEHQWGLEEIISVKTFLGQVVASHRDELNCLDVLAQLLQIEGLITAEVLLDLR